LRCFFSRDNQPVGLTPRSSDKVTLISSVSKSG
jgi:hypothetical protein